MPGTIQVSVLEFVAIQSSSSSSEMSLKISMGKREYQTWDKGDFYFPLTTLRNNLIVTLQNAQGRDISLSVIETKLVIEKGIWDDLFPLEGGGHVHMKLQFILSEEDRHRIRIMRQLALKKKHEELLNNEVKSPKHTLPIAINSTRSLEPDQDREFSDSDKSHLQNEVIASTTSPFALSKTENSVLKKHINPNDTDRYKNASSSSPMPLVSNPDKQNPPEKTHSRIKNMISAFESSLNQDMRPKIRTPSVNTMNKAKLLHEVGIQEEKTSSEDFARVLTGEKASSSGRIFTEKRTQMMSNLLSRRRLSGEKLIKQKSRKEIQPNNLQQVNLQGGSANELYSSECYGALILPEGGKRLCITAGGKKIMDLMGNSHSEATKQPIKMTSPEAQEAEEVKEDREASQRGRKSKNEDESHRGPVGQVMRVVIMVGFATLVFFTRQKKPR